MLQRPTEEQIDSRNAPSDTIASAQTVNRPRSSSSIDVFNPKPNTSASHLPSPNVIPVNLRGNFHQTTRICSTVGREAHTTYGHVRNPQGPSTIPSVSNNPISSSSSNVDERVPLLPSKHNLPLCGREPRPSLSHLRWQSKQHTGG